MTASEVLSAQSINRTPLSYVNKLSYVLKTNPNLDNNNNNNNNDDDGKDDDDDDNDDDNDDHH